MDAATYRGRPSALQMDSGPLPEEWTRTPVHGLIVPTGITIADIPEVGASFTSEGRRERTMVRRLHPPVESEATVIRDEYARYVIAHYDLVNVSPPGQHCPCQLLSGLNICRGRILLGEQRLRCRHLFAGFGLDHTRIATTSRGTRILISSQYDGFFLPADSANTIAAAAGLDLEVTDVNAWLPGRALSVILRRRRSGPDLQAVHALSALDINRAYSRGASR